MTPIEKVRAALEEAISCEEVDIALHELDGMVIVPIEPDTLPKGFTSLDYAVMIYPYLPKEK